ncbi:hypothetical protein SO3561_07999 [Streptomyces olivochromogenes]|uniref:Uncharacterized protein n=1 Tax=Streptomyces olivochromogenes TaxID=1963 RepID=A0A250VQV7_STROL|nr:hypothetical protein SO3561_07999 [Streptomyces olivochromogenes]
MTGWPRMNLAPLISPLGIDHLGNREALYRRTAEISPPGRSSRCGGVLIGRP